MNNERINEISNFLAKDIEATKKLLDLDPEKAASEITTKGFEVTADELVEYGEKLKEMGGANKDELNETELENVAGGVAFSTLLLIGVVAGYAMSKGKW